MIKRMIRNKSFFPRREELEDELDEEVVSVLKGDCEKTDSSMGKVEYSITYKKCKNNNSFTWVSVFSTIYTFMEKTVVLVKPDGVQRGLIGEIITRFERKGLRLAGLKMISLGDAILDEWYAHHKDKSFFPDLKSYMMSYPVVAMLWEGLDAAVTVRKLIGITKARDAEPGTIRGDFAMSQQYNLIHASESVDAARKEEALIFTENLS